MDWQDDVEAASRNEHAWSQAMMGARIAGVHGDQAWERAIPRAYAEQLARMYYPHLFTQ